MLPPGRAPAGVGPRHGPARPRRRRRLPAAARRPARRPGARGRARRGADRRLPRRAVHDRRRRVPGLGLDRHRARARATRATPRRCSRTPTRRCTRPRRPRAAAGPSTRQAGRDPLERLSMAARLRRALAADGVPAALPADLRAPRARLVGRRGAAALARPASAASSSPPSEFIPVAEDTGLIESIGDWVIGAVCAQQVAWAARGLSRRSPSTSRRASCAGSTSSPASASTCARAAPTPRGSPSS